MGRVTERGMNSRSSIEWPMLRPFIILWRHRKLLARTTVSDLKMRFAGSVLGVGWLILQPLLLLAAYSAVYLVIFNIRFSGLTNIEYVAFMFCGLVPFLGFAESLSAGIDSLTSQTALIKNSLFPIEMVPVKAVLAAQAKQMVGIVGIFLGVAVVGDWHWTSLFVIPLWGLQVVFMIGLAWLLAPINTYVRDLHSLAGLATSFLMIISPIAYAPEMVPEGLKGALLCNPLYYMIVPWQEAVVRGLFPRVELWGVFAVMSFAVFFGGFLFFTRLRSVVVDHV